MPHSHEQIRALLAGATAGPWATRAERNCPRAIVIAGTEQIADAGEHTHWTDEQCARNAALIAAAPSIIEQLLGELAASEAARAKEYQVMSRTIASNAVYAYGEAERDAAEAIAAWLEGPDGPPIRPGTICALCEAIRAGSWRQSEGSG